MRDRLAGTAGMRPTGWLPRSCGTRSGGSRRWRRCAGWRPLPAWRRVLPPAGMAAQTAARGWGPGLPPRPGDGRRRQRRRGRARRGWRRSARMRSWRSERRRWAERAVCLSACLAAVPEPQPCARPAPATRRCAAAELPLSCSPPAGPPQPAQHHGGLPRPLGVCAGAPHPALLRREAGGREAGHAQVGGLPVDSRLRRHRWRRGWWERGGGSWWRGWSRGRGPQVTAAAKPAPGGQRHPPQAAAGPRTGLTHAASPPPPATRHCWPCLCPGPRRRGEPYFRRCDLADLHTAAKWRTDYGREVVPGELERPYKRVKGRKRAGAGSPLTLDGGPEGEEEEEEEEEVSGHAALREAVWRRLAQSGCGLSAPASFLPSTDASPACSSTAAAPASGPATPPPPPRSCTASGRRGSGCPWRRRTAASPPMSTATSRCRPWPK